MRYGGGNSGRGGTTGSTADTSRPRAAACAAAVALARTSKASYSAANRQTIDRHDGLETRTHVAPECTVLQGISPGLIGSPLLQLGAPTRQGITPDVDLVQFGGSLGCRRGSLL
jgi:hypothetical protein